MKIEDVFWTSPGKTNLLFIRAVAMSIISKPFPSVATAHAHLSVQYAPARSRLRRLVEMDGANAIYSGGIWILTRKAM